MNDKENKSLIFENIFDFPFFFLSISSRDPAGNEGYIPSDFSKFGPFLFLLVTFLAFNPSLPTSLLMFPLLCRSVPTRRQSSTFVFPDCCSFLWSSLLSGFEIILHNIFVIQAGWKVYL